MSVSNIMNLVPNGDPAARTARIDSAYKAVFSGNGTVDDRDLVLVDLAHLTRYYDTVSLTADPSVVIAAAHQQTVLKRILIGLGGEPQGLMAAVQTAPNPYIEEN